VISVCFLNGLVISVIFYWIEFPYIDCVFIVWLSFCFVYSRFCTDCSNKGSNY
jgi:hypothetical protein